MKNELSIFSNEMFGDIRTVMIDGKVYFNGNDVANALGYNNQRDALIRHCKGVVKYDSSSNGGSQSANYIPQSDVLRLVIKSRLPNAEKFEQWVFEKVIPDLLTKGYASIDNKPRYTLQESAAALMVAYRFEDFPQMQQDLKNIINEAVENDKSNSQTGTKYSKAYNSFYSSIQWNDAKERNEYEQRCYSIGRKPLKTISKMEMCFAGKPQRLFDFLKQMILVENPLFSFDENKIAIEQAIKELDLFPIKDLSTKCLFDDKQSRQTFELVSKSTKKLLN
jgi:prophage antirepressor-like protein